MEGLTIGSAVEVTRINGEPRRGYIVEGPLDILKHIGDFYLISSQLPNFTGRGRKPVPFGMYEGREIRPLI